MGEIAEVVVSAGWEGADAESGLDRLGAKFDKTTGRMRDASGKFVGLKRDTDAATASVSDHGSKLDALGSKLQGAGSAARQFGATLTAGVTLPLAALAAYVVMTGSKTSQALNQFQGTSRATVAEMERVRAKAKELGADLTLPGTSAGQAAQAMLELNKGGLSIKESMDAARGSIQLARAAMVSEAQAANITANALNTYQLAGDQAGRVSDVLANAANKSTGEIADFAMGLSQAGMVARASNVDLEQTVGVLALLANQGIKGSDAGTSFKTFLLALRGPSEDARKAMRALGVDAYDSTGRLKPLGDVVEQFSQKLSGLTDRSRDAFLDKVFGSDGARVAIALFSKGRAELDAYVKSMSEAGTAQRVAEANTRGLSGAWDALMSTVSTFADSVFEDLEGPLVSIVQAVGSAVAWLQGVWDSMGPGAKVVVAALAAVAAAAGPVLVVVGSIVTAVGGLVAAIGSIAGGVAALGGFAVVLPIVLAVGAGLVFVGAQIAAFVAAASVATYALYQAFDRNLGGVRDVALSTFAAVGDYVSRACAELQDIWQRTVPTLLSIASTVLSALSSVWASSFGRLVAVTRAAWGAVAEVTLYVLRQLGNLVDFWAKLVDGDWRGAWDAFSRLAHNAVRAFGAVVSTMAALVRSAFAAAVAAVLSFADRFVRAGYELAKRLVSAVALEIAAGGPAIRDALLAALVWAAANLGAGAIGGQIGQQVVDGMRAAIANGAAQERGGGGSPNWGVAEGPWGAQTIEASKVNPKFGTGGKDLPGLLGGGGGGGRSGGGGGGESPRVKAARAELERLQIIFQAVQRTEADRLADEEYFYGEGRRSIEAYAEARRSAQIRITNEALRAARAELDVAKLTRGTAQEKANAVAAALDKVAEVEAEHRRQMLTIDRDAAKARQDAQREAWANTTARLEEYASAQEDIYQRLADRGVLTFARAQEVIASSQLELLIREQRRLLGELALLDPASPDAKALSGQLDVVNQRRADFDATNPHEAGDASRRDVEREAQRAGDLRSIWESIADSQRESQAERLRILEQAGVSRTALWRAQLNFELQGEREQTTRVVAELRRRIALVEQLEGNPEHRKALVTALNAQIEAEERASTARRASVMEDYYRKQDERLRSYADKAVGSLRKALEASREGGASGFFKSLAEDFRNTLLQMAEDLLKSRLLQLLRNVWKMPAPGSTQGSAGRGQQQPGGEFLDIFKQVFHLGGGEEDASAVSAAGEAMKGAIEQGGATAAQKTTEAGEKQAISIRGVGISIVGALAAIGSQIAAGAGRGGFWKGLLFAAASGAITGAIGAAFKQGGSGGGGSDPSAGLSDFNPGGLDGAAAMGGMFKAKPGGRLIQLAEAGYDELVLTTDPKHRGRMEQLLSAYFDMTGMRPQAFARGGFASGYVPPSRAGAHGADGGRSGVMVKELRVVVQGGAGGGEMTPQQARRTGRQVARATRGALSQYSS